MNYVMTFEKSFVCMQDHPIRSHGLGVLFPPTKMIHLQGTLGYAQWHYLVIFAMKLFD
jgi:hypothetical protein